MVKSSQKKKNKNILIILLVAGTIVFVLSVGRRYQIKVIENTMQYITSPIQKGVNLIFNKTGNITGNFKDIHELQENNEALQKELDQLLYDNNILEQYRDENEKLKELLDLAERHSDYPSKGANIISKDPGNWYKVFIIDQGEKAGFKQDDAVLAGGGLAGHIIETGPLSSKVLSIIDDRSSVSATVLRTGETGILRGDIELIQDGFCKFEIDIESEIITGDQIVTSHLSDIYPPGIMIGVVEEVIISKNGLSQYAHIRPLANFKDLKQVLILEKKGS